MNSIEQGKFANSSPVGGQIRDTTGGGTEGLDFAAALAERSADLPAIADDAFAQEPRLLPGRRHDLAKAAVNDREAAARWRRGGKRPGGVENRDEPPTVNSALPTAQGAGIAIAVLDRTLVVPSSSPQAIIDMPPEVAKPSRQRMGTAAGATYAPPESAGEAEGASDRRSSVGETNSSFKLSVAHQATFFFPARDAEGSVSAVTEEELQPLQHSTHERGTNTQQGLHALSSPATGVATREQPKPVIEPGVGPALPQQTDGPIPGPLSTGGVGDSYVTSGSRMPPTSQWTVPGIALRTLSLQLSPEHLGLVNIELTHADGALKVSIDLEQSDKFDEIEGGRSEIAGRLSDAGYAVQELMVRRSDGPSESSDSIGVPNEAAIGNGPSGNLNRNGGSEHDRRETPDRANRGLALQAVPDSQTLRQSAAEITPWVRLAGLRRFNSV